MFKCVRILRLDFVDILISDCASVAVNILSTVNVIAGQRSIDT